MDYSALRDMRKIIIEKLDEAVMLFDLDLDPHMIDVRFDLKGRTGGYAGYKVNSYGERDYYLRFNIEGITDHWDNMVNVLVPHEIAHIVAFVKPSLGAKGHNRIWSSIDRRLGGNGKRTHNMPLTKVRKTTWYIYEIAGAKVKLSKIRHNRMLSGKTSYSYMVAGVKYKMSVDNWNGRVVVV